KVAIHRRPRASVSSEVMKPAASAVGLAGSGKICSTACVLGSIRVRPCFVPTHSDPPAPRGTPVLRWAVSLLTGLGGGGGGRRLAQRQRPQSVETADPQSLLVQQQRPHLCGWIALRDRYASRGMRVVIDAIQAELGPDVHVAVVRGRECIDVVFGKSGLRP